MTTQPKEPRNQHLIKDDAGRTNRIETRCTEADKEVLQELSLAYGRSMSDLVLDAVRLHLAKLKKKLKK